MKTPEEIKAAVLKECERLMGELSVTFQRPSVEYPSISSSGSPRGVDRYVVWPFGELHDYLIHVVVEIPADDYQWIHAYRLLNIEARELEERAKGLVEVVQKVVETNRNHDWPWHEPNSIMGDIDQMTQTLEAALVQWKGGGK